MKKVLMGLLALGVSAQTLADTQEIVLGSGCFWGAEKRYEAMDGVLDAVSGYADGQGIEPKYSEITKRKYRHDANNFAEVVKVTFDRDKLSLETLLKRYFESHDPTQVNRQGNDVGTQYRSTILTTTPEQMTLAKAIRDDYQALLTKADYGKIATQIKPLTEFYPAEAYHQDYLKKNPNGYCPDHSTGVRFPKSAVIAKKTDTKGKNVINIDKLKQGKQVIIVESEDYCPYCEKFRAETANVYQGSIPMTWLRKTDIAELDINTPLFATPTILFIEDGKEVLGNQGYLTTEQFYKALGHFKLGETDAFNVAFNHGTDNRFCKQYDIFKDTPDGVFVDKLSGVALFDTRHRFNSGTGWLSFTNALPDSTIELADNSYGIQRIEVRSKSSGIHLGHVFDDGPNGQRRFCINATVLEFVKR